MRVMVDARTVYARHRRGTGKNLIDLYATMAQQQPEWEFVMVHQVEATDDPWAGLANVRRRQVDIRGDRYNLWQDVQLPLTAWEEGASVLHCPANTAPRFTFTPLVVTIHDLNPLEIAPEAAETRRWKRRVGSGARRARRILAPSEYSRQAIAREFRVGADKIRVNYWAPDRRAVRASQAAIADVRERYDVGDHPYILAFGAEDPRKNTAAIMAAWSRLPVPVRSSSRLLIIGLQPDALARARADAARMISDESCVLTGFAAEADISPLMSGSHALCYPSRAEGFGLPVVDAFACHTPVITSTATSLPEVAGNAALLVDADDVDAIGHAMHQMLTSASLRERLVHLGQERLTLFSWVRCARTAAEVLHEAAV